MYWITIYGDFFMICLVIKFDWSSGVQVTKLSVPTLVDPRDSMALGCTYEMAGEELHSVKWYKDEQEFFRYTPRQQPHVMSFPMAGVHLEQQLGMPCNLQQCSIRLTHLSTQYSGGAYKCEVSTEAPKFRVGFRSGNVTVAAVGRTEPQVLGVNSVYAAGDLIQANCTAAAADPAPLLTWLLNGAPISTGLQRVSSPDQHGLVIASRDLRFIAERRHFPAPDHLLRVVCVATPPPYVPAPPLASQNVTIRMFDLQVSTHQQQRDVLQNQQLAWSNSTNQKSIINFWLSSLAVCILLL